MFSTDPEQRKAFTAGLRQLADFIDADPGVPVPYYGTTIFVLADLAEHGGVEQIEALAGLFQVPLVIDPESLDRFAARRQFGPVTYEAVTHTAISMVLHRALHTYDGCVTPDD
jgi:hypothetical protein